MADVKKPIVMLLILPLIIISNVVTFQNKYESLIKDFENTAKSTEALINRHIDLISGYMDILSVFGSNNYKKDMIEESDLYHLLRYEEELNYYHLDVLEGMKLKEISGNLTGFGIIPKTGEKRNEINASLQLNKIFNKVYNKLPDAEWLYYISENDFVIRYPWQPSKEFRYLYKLKKSYLYIQAAPKLNPFRDSVWAPAYFNTKKERVILSCSTPVYNKDRFLGVITMDFNNSRLKEMVGTRYESYLVDIKGTVIASNHISSNQFIKLDKQLGITSDSYIAMRQMKINRVERMGGYYVYSVKFSGAPWQLYLRVPAWLILLKSFVTNLPILFLCMFLIFTIKEIDKRRKTEELLKNSIEELRSYQKLLESAAKMDFLTATYNRRGFKEKLTENIKNSRKKHMPMAFIIGDIDNFKQYNDTYGHKAGDKVLIQAADIMKKNISRSDIVCRWGGEEFLIMLLNKSYEEALQVAETIREKVETADMKIDNDTVLHVTITLGVTDYRERDNFDDCIARADQALYIGKESGRNKVIGSRELSQ